MVTRTATATDPAPEPPTETNAGVMLGVTLGILAPAFHGSDAWSSPPTLGTGPTLGVSAGYRWRFLYIGAAYQHAFLGGGSWEAPSSEYYVENTLWARADYIGLDVMAITDSEALIAATFRVAAGYRFLAYRSDVVDSGTAASTTSSVDWDLTLLAVGVQIHGGAVRVIPEVSLGIGDLFPYVSAEVTTYLDWGSMR
jgi:hypothetical protein